jgi:maleate isomerase/arylmalonate decarboxylase
MPSTVNREHYRPYGWRAKIGLIVPPTNTVNEGEWARMAPEGVTVHVTRMKLHAEASSPEGEGELYADIEKATRDLAAASLDAIAYGCTAGSMVMPLSKLTDHMSGIAGVPCVATAASLVHACRALGLARGALATPYHDALNAHERDFLAANGIEVVAVKGLGIGAGGPHEYVRIARVPKDEVLEHVRSVDRPDAQGLIISCTDFATLEAVPQLERALGKPVVTSNQATFWAALRAAGVDDRFRFFGRLLQEH